MVAPRRLSGLARSRRCEPDRLWLAPGADLSAFAGRAYAAYGGVYIVASVLWMWLAEGERPDRWDLIGGVVCLAGAALILLAPRSV